MPNPRQPTDEEQQRYNVETIIERKVDLMHKYETEFAFLREHPVSRSKSDSDYRERNVPHNLDLAKKFYEKCERLIEQPATTPEE